MAKERTAAGPSTWDPRLMRGFPPPPELRVAAEQVYADVRHTQWFMQHVREVEPTADVSARHELVLDLPHEPRDLDSLLLPDAGDESIGAAPGMWTFAEMLTGTDTEGVAVLKDGKVLCERYFGSLRPETPHLWHSITKSLASCVAARLIEQGLLEPQAAIVAHVPELAGSAYGDATVRHLLDMTVAVRYVEDHENFDTEDSRLDRLCGLKPRRSADEPGSAYDFATTLQKDGAHGRVLHYVSLNTDVLGWVMERATGRPVPALVRDEIWSQLGTEHDAYIALDGAGSAQLDGGFCGSLRDLARFGLMLAGRGRIAGRQVVPAAWIDDVQCGGDRAAFAASEDPDMLPGGSYRSCFWVAEHDGRTALLGVGMYGQMLYVDPDTGIVIARLAAQPRAGLAAPVTRSFHAFHALAGELV